MDARQRWTLILTSVASLMVGLDLTVVTTALNTIRLDLGASIAELDWTINAYTLTIGVLLLTAAAAGDRLGRRRVLVAGLAVFTASSAACGITLTSNVPLASLIVKTSLTACNEGVTMAVSNRPAASRFMIAPFTVGTS